jgi:hypothetical protein
MKYFYYIIALLLSIGGIIIFGSNGRYDFLTAIILWFAAGLYLAKGLLTGIFNDEKRSKEELDK